MPPFPGPREMLCCTRNPVITFTCPLSIFVGKDTSKMRFGVRSTWRSPGSSFSTSAAISNWICAIRNGFSSSRGVIRGTIDGAPVGLVRTGCFATVAISFGPFLGSCLNSLAYCRAGQLESCSCSGVCHKFLRLAQKLVPAILGAKVHVLPAAAFHQGQIFRDVHAANRIAQ